MTRKLQIGFVGLGMMGAPMAARLVAAGFPLAVFDIDADAQAAFVQRTGARGCASVAEVGENCEVAITMLPSGAVVSKAILGGPGQLGLLDGREPALLVVDMSTAAPGETRTTGAAVAARGGRMIDAPVSGGVARAEAGTLAIMAGGDWADVASCSEIFAVLGEASFHTGPLGSGHAVKALNNAVSAAGLIAAGEALIVGQRAGVDPGVMLAVLNASTGRNNATENKIAQFVLSRTYASGFALRLMAKDLAIAADLASELHVSPELLQESARIAIAADEALGQGADHTAVVRWLEQEAGVVLEAGEDENGRTKGITDNG